MNRGQLPNQNFFTTKRLLFIIFFLQIIFIFYHFSSFLIDTNSFSSKSSSRLPFINHDFIKLPFIDVDSFQPENGIAFAIPVGGNTHRIQQLKDILLNLINNGVKSKNIFIFEDNFSRRDSSLTEKTSLLAKQYSVNFIQSNINIYHDIERLPQNHGLHLSQHYHFMFEHLFTKNSPPFPLTVIIEDDLKLSDDFVSFFYGLSEFLIKDRTLFCVSAHQDNAFHVSSPDSDIRESIYWGVRRGEHFMAPGFMISLPTYLSLIKPLWFDKEGNFFGKSELELPNAHWDRFFDSICLSHNLECLFPAIPRISHQGSGYTIDAKTQLSTYANIKLSKLQSFHYNLDILSPEGYHQNLIKYLKESQELIVFEEIFSFRNRRLKFLLKADSDHDINWNKFFYDYLGVIGLGGYGGNPKYGKMRGIHRGIVIINILSNILFVVASYSPYSSFFNILDEKTNHKLANDNTLLNIKYYGCYSDHFLHRILPFLIPYYTTQSLSPMKCLLSCDALGYKISGCQNGNECWCGHHLPDISFRRNPKQCNNRCLSSSSSLFSFFWNSNINYNLCGGPLALSIYSFENYTSTLMVSDLSLKYNSDSGLTCFDVCSNNQLHCKESFYPYWPFLCPEIQKKLGCNQCLLAPTPQLSLISPIKLTGSESCYIAPNRYANCHQNNDIEQSFTRACLCYNDSFLK